MDIPYQYMTDTLFFECIEVLGFCGVTCLIIVAEFPIGVVESMVLMFMSVKNLGRPFNGNNKEGYVDFTTHGVLFFERFQF